MKKVFLINIKKKKIRNMIIIIKIKFEQNIKNIIEG